MPRTRHAVWILLLASSVACTRPDQPRTAANGSASSTPPAAAPSASSLVSHFLGCYELSIDGGNLYRIRLTDTRTGPLWSAINYGTGSRNAAGDQWSWAPRDSTHFTLEWGGVDAAMSFSVAGNASHYRVAGYMQQSQEGPPTDLHPTLRRVECPSPAA